MRDDQLIKQIQLSLMGKAARIRDLEAEVAALKQQLAEKPKEVEEK